MGVSVTYMAVPLEFAEALRRDEGLKDVFIAIFGCGSGIERFFSELPQDEINEITEGLSHQDIDRLRELIEKTRFGKEAHIENTFDLHVTGLEEFLKRKGVADPRRTAELIVGGDDYKLDDFILGFDPAEVKYMSSLLSGNHDEILSHYSFEGPYGDPLWKEAIVLELKRIIACYESANEIKGEVWIGFL